MLGLAESASKPVVAKYAGRAAGSGDCSIVGGLMLE
jgi:hypothetical protein